MERLLDVLGLGFTASGFSKSTVNVKDLLEIHVGFRIYSLLFINRLRLKVP